MVHPEEIVSLVARAEASWRFPDLPLRDPSAAHLLAELHLGTQTFDPRALRMVATGTAVMDALVRSFFARNPEGLAISVYPGLCTRFSRVDNGSLRWIDVDPAGLAEFKAGLLRTPPRHVLAACCSLDCKNWLRQLQQAQDIPTLLIAEGALRRLPHAAADALFSHASVHAPKGTELLVQHDARLPLRSSRPGPGGHLQLHGASTTAYPRIRFVDPSLHDAALAAELDNLHKLARVFGGVGAPRIAHLRFE